MMSYNACGTMILQEGAQPAVEEERSVGKIGSKIFVQYFGAGYGSVLMPLFLFFAIASQSIFNVIDWLISEW